MVSAGPIHAASVRASIVAADPEQTLRPRDVALARLSDALLAHLAGDELVVCEHAAEILAAGSPLIWTLEQELLTCLVCAMSMTADLEVNAPTSHCSTCNRQRPYELRHAAVAVGPVLVYADICRRCRRLQQDPPYDGVRAAEIVTTRLKVLLDPTPGGEAA